MAVGASIFCVLDRVFVLVHNNFWYFLSDCTVPPDDIVDQFLRISEAHSEGAIAVCVSVCVRL